MGHGSHMNFSAGDFEVPPLHPLRVRKPRSRFSLCDSRTVIAGVPKEPVGQSIDISLLLYIIIAVLIGIGVTVFIALVCYYRRQMKASASEWYTTQLCTYVSVGGLFVVFPRQRREYAILAAGSFFYRLVQKVVDSFGRNFHSWRIWGNGHIQHPRLVEQASRQYNFGFPYVRPHNLTYSYHIWQCDTQLVWTYLTSRSCHPTKGSRLCRPRYFWSSHMTSSD